MTQDTVFTHRPQPPLIPPGQPQQRWFSGMGHQQVRTPNALANVSVYAFAGEDTVRLTLGGSLGHLGAHITINLGPQALCTLARALVDAAASLPPAGPANGATA